jgi:hypothetical protein
MSDTTSDTDLRTRPRRAGNARTLLMVAGPFLAAGIALAGALGLLIGLHRYGRLGADPPLDLGTDSGA